MAARAAPAGACTVVVKDAQGLRLPRTLDLPSPYCVVTVGEKSEKLPRQDNTRSPKWPMNALHFPVMHPFESVRLDFYHPRTFAADVHLASFALSLADFTDGRTYEAWHTLTSPTAGMFAALSPNTSSEAGKVLLAVTCILNAVETKPAVLFSGAAAEADTAPPKSTPASEVPEWKHPLLHVSSPTSTFDTAPREASVWPLAAPAATHTRAASIPRFPAALSAGFYGTPPDHQDFSPTKSSVLSASTSLASPEALEAPAGSLPPEQQVEVLRQKLFAKGQKVNMLKKFCRSLADEVKSLKSQLAQAPSPAQPTPVVPAAPSPLLASVEPPSSPPGLSRVESKLAMVQRDREVLTQEVLEYQSRLRESEQRNRALTLQVERLKLRLDRAQAPHALEMLRSLRLIFGLPEDEQLVDTYACAGGRLHLFTQYLCFEPAQRDKIFNLPLKAASMVLKGTGGSKLLKLALWDIQSALPERRGLLMTRGLRVVMQDGEQHQFADVEERATLLHDLNECAQHMDHIIHFK